MSVGMAAVCAMLGANAAMAQTVNFDVAGGFAGAVNYVGQGAYSDPGNNAWNAVGGSPHNYSWGGSTTSSALNSDGSSSSVTLTLPASGSYQGGQGAQGTPSGLIGDILFNTTGSPLTGSLDNVAAGTYDLFLYGGNFGMDRGTIFTASVVGGASYGSLSTVGRNAFNNEGQVADDTFVAGDNYVEFTGITLAALGTIDFTFAANTAINRPGGLGDYSGVNGEGDFNGLQLVAAPVPEPSTYAMLVIGAVGLAGSRMFKRRAA